MPYFPYSRQDKIGLYRNSMTSKILLKMIEIAGAKRVVTFDAHSAEFCNFPYLPVINLNPYFLLVDQLKKIIDISNCVIIAPDFGGIVRCGHVIRAHSMSFALIHKGMKNHNNIFLNLYRTRIRRHYF